jgi:hypothetical protein
MIGTTAELASLDKPSQARLPATASTPLWV